MLDLGPVLEHAILRISVIIQDREDEAELRRSLFTNINSLPLVNRELNELARSYVAFSYILYYERVRNGVAKSSFFCLLYTSPSPRDS